MNKINLLIIGALLVLTISCSSLIKGKELAESAVEKFHSQFNEKNFNDIYNQSDEEFKKAGSEKEFLESLQSIHLKLGKVNRTNFTNWKVNTTTSGTFAIIECDVEFSAGNGNEQFVFHIVDDKATLYNYTINSPLLITN